MQEDCRPSSKGLQDLEAVLGRLQHERRWADPKQQTPESPEAGAMPQVTLVLCGRAAAALRQAVSAGQSEAALSAVQRTIGAELLVSRLSDGLEVEMGCLLETGRPAAEQGVAVTVELLSLLAQLETGTPDATLRHQMLPVLIECLLTGLQTAWQGRWEVVQPMIRPVYDLALQVPLLPLAPTAFLSLVRRCLPEVPDEKCLWSIGSIAQEIQESFQDPKLAAVAHQELDLMQKMQARVVELLDTLHCRPQLFPLSAKRFQSYLKAHETLPSKPCKKPEVRQDATPDAANMRRCGQAGVSEDEAVPPAESCMKSDQGKKLQASASTPSASTLHAEKVGQRAGIGPSMRVPACCRTTVAAMVEIAGGPRKFARNLGVSMLQSIKKLQEVTSEPVLAAEADDLVGKLQAQGAWLEAFLVFAKDPEPITAELTSHLVSCLLESGPLPTKIRAVLGPVHDVILSPSFASKAASELWQKVQGIEGGARVPRPSPESSSRSAGWVYAAGSLAKELEEVLLQEGEQHANPVLLPGSCSAIGVLRCVQWAAYLHVQWLGCKELCESNFRPVEPELETGSNVDRSRWSAPSSSRVRLGEDGSDSERDASESVDSRSSDELQDQGSDLDDFIDDSRPELIYGFLVDPEDSTPEGSTFSPTEMSIDKRPPVRDDWKDHCRRLLDAHPMPELPDFDSRPLKYARMSAPSAALARAAVG